MRRWRYSPVAWFLLSLASLGFFTPAMAQVNYGSVQFTGGTLLSQLVVSSDGISGPSNITEFKNGTNAQEIRVYETDAANDNFLIIDSESSNYRIITGTSGGSHRPMIIGPQGNSGTLNLQTQAVTQWSIDASGFLVGTAKLFANLGTPADGRLVYCSDCTIANPCAGSGTGAFAKRLGGAWVCN